jgi:hypothetical protein
MIEELQGDCWWYCSFATDEKFLGAVLAFGDGGPRMLATLGSVGLNPGGEVLMVPWPFTDPPHERYRGRILSKAELEEWDKEHE